jgi:transitional endoplasmic reticulum ATPase
MGEFETIWRIVAALSHGFAATTPVVKAVVKWARDNRAALKIAKPAKGKTLGWRMILAHANAHRNAGSGTDTTGAMATAEAVVRALQLGEFDAAMLRLAIAADRFPLVRGLCEAIGEAKVDLALLFAQMAGARPGEARRRVMQCELIRLGLVRVNLGRDTTLRIETCWALDRLVDHCVSDDSAIIEAFAGKRQAATLSPADYAAVACDVDFIIRLINGAAASGERGINVLIHGPPGTGKTELARTICAAAQVALFSIGEADSDGDEPGRWDRVQAFRRAQRVAERRAATVLLFDEMEDLIGDARPMSDGTFSDREGSKIFLNRMLETNAAPVIWTTNALRNIDTAILRRMSFVLKLDYPTPEAAQLMLDRLASDESVALTGDALRRLATHAPEAATVMRSALRTGRIAGGGEWDASMAATSLICAMRGGQKVRLPDHDPAAIDLALYEGDRDIAALVDRLASDATPNDFSLLLTGPPGTGKTALAHHLARRLERPLIVKRASDLLSKWVGETEQQIAAAFEEAVHRQGVLLFDEVDSLLHNRGNAQRSWEVTQVNELLTWFDSHPLPFIAATNHGQKLDPAALRRFVFKLDLRPLSEAKAAAAYARFFGHQAPSELHALHGLTPGDLAVVARQLRYADGQATPAYIMQQLAAELEAKPGAGRRIGF